MRIAPVFLFDLDGTLVDSVYLHVLAWKEALEAEAIELSVWRIYGKIGMSGGLLGDQLLRETGVEKSPGLVDRLRQLHEAAYRMPATTDGAILAKMADRRQILGGIVDGPLDLDAAVDIEAARTKHIVSPVAGYADILIVPSIEAGNVVYKDLVFMADAQSAGLVVGAKVPIILTSRADGAEARRFAAAAAVIYANSAARDPFILTPEISE